MSYGTPPPGGPSDSEENPPQDRGYAAAPPPSSGDRPPPAPYGDEPTPAPYGQQPPPAPYGQAPYGQAPQAPYGQAPPAPYGQPAPGYGAAPPPMYGGGPAGAAPKNWLWLSIVSVLFCWPLAIPAIVFSSRVNGKWAAGDAAGAQSSSGRARMFGLVAIGLGVIAGIVQVVIGLSNR